MVWNNKIAPVLQQLENVAAGSVSNAISKKQNREKLPEGVINSYRQPNCFEKNYSSTEQFQ